MSVSVQGAFYSEIGIGAIWDRAHFQSIIDFDTWQQELSEDMDIIRHIKAGAFVPLCTHSEDVFGWQVRVGNKMSPAVLTPREEEYLILTSHPYLLRATGDVYLSNSENVCGQPASDVAQLSIPQGSYAVTVTLLDWEKDPKAKDKYGFPTRDVLPDFLILVNPFIGERGDFRTNPETFDDPVPG